MIFKANEATYDASGRSVRNTQSSEVGRGQLFIRDDERTNGSIAFRIVNNVVHLQRRIDGVWQDTSLITNGR